jgi:hypothetical protein
MQCTQQRRVRTKGGYLKKPLETEQCPGHIEGHTRIFLDIEAEPTDIEGYDIKLTKIAPSHLNDEVDGIPLNLEAELVISCSECGYEYSADLGPSIREVMGLQPIGDAERTLGVRGGR